MNANPNISDIALIVGPVGTDGSTVSDSDTALDIAGKRISDVALLAELTGSGYAEIGVGIGLDIRGSISPYFPHETITGNLNSTNYVEAILEVVYVYDPVKPLPEIDNDRFSDDKVR